jgi:preprotein translocase subunit SecG
MLTTFTVFTALICVLLIASVLIQNPKGGGLDSTFGGNQASQMFGAARSSDFIEKATWILAGLLFIMCIIIAITVGGTGAATEQLLSQ